MDVLGKNYGFYISADKINFFVVGCGGNGSFLVPNLARIVAINNQKYEREDTITLIDKDTVEEKNITRQNFVSPDVGKNKAKVLAQRYSRAFGLDIAYIDEYITEENVRKIIHVQRESNSIMEYMVILGCVDNNATRHLLHDLYRNAYIYGVKKIYIDAGNEEFAGQLVFSSEEVACGDNSEISIRNFHSTRILDIVEEFDLDKSDKHPDELSCAERAVSAPQNIATNIKAADLMLGYCNTLISGAVKAIELKRDRTLRDLTTNETIEFIKKIPRIMAHVTYFDSRTGQTSLKYFNHNIQDRIKNKEEADIDYYRDNSDNPF